MTTGQTVGRLWRQYLKVWEQLAGRELADDARSDLERQAGQFKGRLVVNYSPLVKYVANRTGARMTEVGKQEDIMFWGELGLLDAIETFDLDRPSKKAKFESYAISKIRWAILEEIRSQD